MHGNDADYYESRRRSQCDLCIRDAWCSVESLQWTEIDPNGIQSTLNSRELGCIANSLQLPQPLQTAEHHLQPCNKRQSVSLCLVYVLNLSFELSIATLQPKWDCCRCPYSLWASNRESLAMEPRDGIGNWVYSCPSKISRYTNDWLLVKCQALVYNDTWV